MEGSAVFSGVFELRESVSEEEFLPALKAFFEHFNSHLDIAFSDVRRWRSSVRHFPRLHIVALSSTRT